jgi:hypothetical protein
MRISTLLPALILLSQGVLTPVVASTPTEGTLDELVVEAKRTRLTELRNEMIRLEDEFYARYNELNENDDFDISCAREARVGTRLERRYCRAVYENEIMAVEGRDYHIDLLRCCDTSTPIPKGTERPPAQPPVPAIVMIEARKPDFRKTMVTVTSAHPELTELLRQRAEAAQRYEATRRKLFGNKAPADP